MEFLQMNMSSAQIERNKTKEQLEEEKKISLSIRIKPLAIDNLSIDKLKGKATELWDQIVKLETEKYDLEERQKRQDYDVSTLPTSLSCHPALITIWFLRFHLRERSKFQSQIINKNLRLGNCFTHIYT